MCQFEFLMMFPGNNRRNTERMRGVSGSDIRICSIKCGTVIADCQRMRRMLFAEHPIICLFNIFSLLASLVRFLQYYEQLSLQINLLFVSFLLYNLYALLSGLILDIVL